MSNTSDIIDAAQELQELQLDMALRSLQSKQGKFVVNEYCDDCGEEIPEARRKIGLEKQITIKCCIDCQEIREKNT